MYSYSSDASDPDPIYGGIEFERSCAICHGFNGKGKGVMSDSLTKQPADLTVLTKNNNGHFPFTEVYQMIEGSPRVGVHGSRDMPVWGDRYRKESEKYGADEYLYSRGLILELLIYLMAIQEK
ncbi:MAG: c-type cytochrome [Gammaproteobacteria bacterium]